ncbi:MAG: phosphoribosyltransferase family protein [Ilumatobacteraceae bacterium]
MLFADRVEAGRRLAARLEHLRGMPVVVLGLPRGGVPVTAEVALSLEAPMDVIVVRKLGVPFQPELAMGAIGEGGARVINEEVVRLADVSNRELAAVEAREQVELDRRARQFRGDRPRQPLAGRIVIVVDDGIATGSTARVACRVARAQGAVRVVLAVPVAPADWMERFRDEADEMICVSSPASFRSVGQFYADFTQTTDEDVVACLERVAAATVRTPRDDGGTAAVTAEPVAIDEEVSIRSGSVRLYGHLTIPEHAVGVVVFAHGSGSSRHSPRNQFVASVLNRARLGTLLFDLLTDDEENNRANVFDIELLARRLIDTTRWLRTRRDAAALRVGYFGASTGAAAALWAAAEPGSNIAAVVSRGGRPDLAAARLPAVTSPTLLIVGGADHAVLGFNRTARALLGCEVAVLVVPHATHLFEEPGTLTVAAEAARDWFLDHL